MTDTNTNDTNTTDTKLHEHLGLGADDLVYAKGDGKTIAGGFSVDSIMMKMGISPITTINSGDQTGGGDDVASIFKNLVIPNWALSYNTMSGGKRMEDIEDDDEVIDDDLHDRLLDLVKEHDIKKAKKKRITRKSRPMKNNKTRKMK